MQLQVFPNYASKFEQFRYTDGLDFNLYAPHNAFLPFLLMRPSAQRPITCITVYNELDQVIIYVSGLNFPYRFFSDGVTDYYFYFGELIPGLDLPCGKYYWQILDRVSEIFTVGPSLDKLLRLSWFSDSVIGSLRYPAGWEQVVYLDTSLEKPEYPVNTEYKPDGEGTDYLQTGRVSKVLQCTTDLLPEFMVDALSALPLHSNVQVGPYRDVRKISSKSSWEYASLNAVLVFQFTEAEVLLQPCPDLTLIEVVIAPSGPLPGECGTDVTAEPVWVNTGETRCQTEEYQERQKAWRPQESSAYCLKD